MTGNFKEIALQHAELIAKDGVNLVFDLIKEAVNVSENKIDDMFLPLLSSLQPKVIELCENIYKGEE